MSTTSGGFPLMAQTQAQRYLTHNELAWAVDVLQQGVLDRDLATPPGSPSEGDAYIVADSATGAWTGHENEIAFYFGSVWNFLQPELAQGNGIFVQDEAVRVRWNPAGSPAAYEVLSLATDAADVTYTPADNTDWTGSADPGNVDDALDQLAERVTNIQGTGLDADASGFRGIPQNSQSGNYTTGAADAGKHLYHASGAGSGDTFTIDSNANVAYEIGTAITFVNMDSDAVSIAITSDTLYLAGTGTTGMRSLAQYGVATAIKLTSTTWIISGTGLT